MGKWWMTQFGENTSQKIELKAILVKAADDPFTDGNSGVVVGKDGYRVNRVWERLCMIVLALYTLSSFD